VKLRIHAGSVLPSSLCTMMHDFDNIVVVNVVAEFSVLLCVLVTMLLTG